jgi:hypothetical protein
MSATDSLEKRVLAILQKHCDYGWGYHYILREKFGHIVGELKELLQPQSEVSDFDLVQFLLKIQGVGSEQERAERLKKEFLVLKRPA